MDNLQTTLHTLAIAQRQAANDTAKADSMATPTDTAQLDKLGAHRLVDIAYYRGRAAGVAQLVERISDKLGISPDDLAALIAD